MNIKGNFNDIGLDLRLPSGGYQWWYFDFLDPETGVSGVFIFYLGNPFSHQYIRELDVTDPRPQQFPALSISLYKGNEVLFNGFEEYIDREAFFDEAKQEIRFPSARVKWFSDRVECEVKMCLPNGWNLNLETIFKPKIFFSGKDSEVDSLHDWNLMAPVCKVDLGLNLDSIQKLKLEKTVWGYHDRNAGSAPMKNDFDDWYWGRFHAEQFCFVYYLMNKNGNQTQFFGWLHHVELGEFWFSEAKMGDYQRSRFGLSACRRLEVEAHGIQLRINHLKPVENSPFYLRFISELHQNGLGAGSEVVGISEYIRPKRIYSRLFWPLVRMRVQQQNRSPHWVSRSPFFTKWTW